MRKMYMEPSEEPNEDIRGNISVPLFILTALFYLPYMEILVSRKKSGIMAQSVIGSN